MACCGLPTSKLTPQPRGRSIPSCGFGLGWHGLCCVSAGLGGGGGADRAFEGFPPIIATPLTPISFSQIAN